MHSIKQIKDSTLMNLSKLRIIVQCYVNTLHNNELHSAYMPKFDKYNKWIRIK